MTDINDGIHTDSDELICDDSEPPEPPGNSPGFHPQTRAAGRLKAACLNVGVAYNLKRNAPSALPDAEAEFDDIDTIRAIQNALESAGCDVALYEATEEFPAMLSRNRPDIVFNIAEGMNGRGREAQVPAILSFLGIPFTGSDETTMCLAMDKALAKRLVASHGVHTPQYRLIKQSPTPETDLAFPVIVKPNSEGSGKGITGFSVVNDSAALNRLLAEKMAAYNEDMLAEEYITGREFTVGILGNGDKLRVFPPMEIIFNDKSGGIYSCEVKKNFRQYVSYKCPADISVSLENEIKDAAETVFRALECRDMARVDFRLSPEGKLYFIEINPLPGLAPGYSDFPMIAEFCGMDYQELIQTILNNALTRYGLPNRVLP
ncbi:MAG: ATP-grasp domain-containing protein [Treponema sp.]|nr:ATP-grasp domain-containing protein [Treponema sp.]